MLEFAAAAADHGATFACASFAPETMERPMMSAFAITLNVTCEYATVADPEGCGEFVRNRYRLKVFMFITNFNMND